MIQLIPAADDDAVFLALAGRIINGALAALEVRELFLVRIDNWFDHKWLGFGSRWEHGKVEGLRVPRFTPNRVCSEQHFQWDLEASAWQSVDLLKPLHVRQPGRPWLAQPLDRYSKSAAFIWYSGKTAANHKGSLLFYLSGANGYSWYASLKKGEPWAIADEFQATRHELLSFAERGAEMEVREGCKIHGFVTRHGSE
jgi:hypothetical protein